MAQPDNAKETIMTEPIDPRPVFAAASAWVADLMQNVTDDMLTRPTPCAEFDVKTLCAHLIATALGARVIAVDRNPRALALATVLVARAAGTGPVAVPDAFQVAFLDVGQGDATLLRHGARAVLVDAGPPDGGVVSRLRALGVRRLDALVLTHAQADHDGGAPGRWAEASGGQPPTAFGQDPSVGIVGFDGSRAWPIPASTLEQIFGNWRAVLS